MSLLFTSATAGAFASAVRASDASLTLFLGAIEIPRRATEDQQQHDHDYSRLHRTTPLSARTHNTVTIAAIANTAIPPYTAPAPKVPKVNNVPN